MKPHIKMRAVNRIVFIVEALFNERDYNRFGIELFLANGFDVEVWDFTPLLHPEANKKVKVPDPINFEGLKRFYSWDESIAAIRSLSADCLIILLVGYYFNSYKVYKTISSNSIRYAVVEVDSVPPINCKTVITSLTSKLHNLNIGRITNAIFSRIPFTVLGIRAADIVLAGAESAIDNIRYPVANTTEYLWIHTLDYDIYLNSIGNPHVDNTYKNACVFLDQYLSFHPDNIYEKEQPLCPSIYYPRLCSFFDKLEKELNIEVIIAPHPRAHYSDNDPLFGGRRIIRGSSFDLVRATLFTIAHYSTAINFPVMLGKPIVFITTNQLQQSYLSPYIENIASLLGKKEINVDEKVSIDWERELCVDRISYGEYMNKYIKRKGTDNVLFWQKVCSHLIDKDSIN